MIMCSQCKKRPAVVFLTSMQGGEKKNEGLCVVCAKERHIPQIAEYMEKLGITDDELEQMSNQMMDILDGDSFEMGGSDTIPDFIQNMLNETPFASHDKKNDKKDMLSLTYIENKILTLIKQNSTITYEALGQTLALGETSVYQAIRHLKELNIISREGGRKNGNWVINVELNRVQI